MSLVYFVTGNPRKAEEIVKILAKYGITAERIHMELVEVQSDSLEEIALEGAREAAGRAGRPVLVEDSGLFINALKGFPGPYSAYVRKTIGNEGVLKLMKGVKQRSAVFRSVVAYYKRGLPPFVGEAQGTIALEERGGGWGFDPIFIPEGSVQTYGEMGTDEKNRISHRKMALEKFAAGFLKGFL